MAIRRISRVFGRASPVQIIGVAGETNATILEIDVSETATAYPSAKYSIVVKRGMEESYLADVLLTPRNGQLGWAVPTFALTTPGDIIIEVEAYDGGTLIKSSIWRFWVGGSISAGENPPSPPESSSWLKQILDSINSAVAPVVFCESKHDRPAFGAPNTLYVIDDTAYVWNADPPKYLPLFFDIDATTHIDLMDGGSES